MYDLRDLQHAGAAFAPACQLPYTRFVGVDHTEALRPTDVVKRDLDFLHADTRLCRLRTVLISAFPRMTHRADCMIEGRDRTLDSVVIMDSGGYSIINTGYVPGPDTARQTLRRQERVADVAITLDVPTQTIDKGINKAFDTFDKCLAANLSYLRDYDRYRRSTKLIVLNVLQGRTIEECNQWFDAVKQFEFEGWAFAGKLRLKFSTVLKRILQMLSEHKLDCCPRIHFLGTGRLDVAIILTAVQDGLRMVLNDQNLVVSYDDAASSLNVWKRKTGHMSAHISHRRLEWDVARFPDHPDYVGRCAPYPVANSPIARHMRWGDICVRRGARSTWDDQSKALLENHVTYVRVAAFGEVARRSKLYAVDAAQLVPSRLVELRDLIIQVLVTGRHDLIDRWASQLDQTGRLTVG